MTPEECDGFATATAAYVHTPFCSAVCPYCDFAVIAGRDDLAGHYLDAVVAEIGAAEPWWRLDGPSGGAGHRSLTTVG